MTQQQKTAALVERLKSRRQPTFLEGTSYKVAPDADCIEAAALIEQQAATITAQAARIAELEKERVRIKAFLSDGGYETIQSEQAWKQRAITAERALATARADAFEEAVKIVKGNLYHGRYRQWPQWGPGNRDEESEIVRFADCLAAAIRAASNTGASS